MADPRFSIVIPSFNEAENLTAVVAEARAAPEAHAAQIIVVDDASTAGLELSNVGSAGLPAGLAPFHQAAPATTPDQDLVKN